MPYLPRYLLCLLLVGPFTVYADTPKTETPPEQKPPPAEAVVPAATEAEVAPIENVANASPPPKPDGCVCLKDLAHDNLKKDCYRVTRSMENTPRYACPDKNGVRVPWSWKGKKRDQWQILEANDPGCKPCEEFKIGDPTIRGEND